MNAAGKRNWAELAATALLACAAVATAWSSYQATRWNGEQAKTASRVNKTRIDAARAAGRANCRDAGGHRHLHPVGRRLRQDETELASFYRTRFRDEFKPAFDAWIATRPLEIEWRGAHAVCPPAVQARQGGRGRAPRRAGRGALGPVRRDIQRASNYVLAVVLFAVALFFAGMSTKLGTAGLRATMLTVGWIVFLGAAAWVATSPMSVGV